MRSLVGPLLLVAFVILGALPSCGGGGQGFGPSDGGGNGDDGSSSGGSSSGGGDGAITCSQGQLVCSGACVKTSSCSFAPTSLSPSMGWQNGGGYVKVLGAGFAPGITVSIGGGKAPALYVDPGTILIQTPPGPFGPQDVTVALGAKTATLIGGFTYQGGGLESTWQQKNLTVGRANGPALGVLQDGRVLIAGGTSGLTWDTAVASADLYTEPAPSAVLATSSMSTPRFAADAIPLLDNRVLVAGGACQYSAAWPAGKCLGDATALDVFDASKNTFTQSKAHFPPPPAAAMESPAGAVAASGVLLADGRVFLVTNTLPGAFVYDPVADSLKSVSFPAPFPSGFAYGLDYPFVVRLRDGRVLVGAGDLAVVQMPTSFTFLFDPSNDTLSATGAFAKLRSGARATTLPDGRVMVVGGADPNNSYLAVDTIELYDPTAGTFALAPYKLSTPRNDHAAVLVRDGTVLALGGSDGGIKDCTTPSAGLTATVDQIDPVKGTVTPFPPLPRPAEGIGGVVTLDGSVFVGGGAICGDTTVQPYVDFLQGRLQ